MLFVAPRYLLPADSGGKIRTGQVLRGLKGGAFEVTLMSPAPADAAERNAAELETLCDRFAAWDETERGTAFSYLRLRHIFSRRPISVASDSSRSGRQAIAGELRNNPDVVVIDFPHTAVLMPQGGAFTSVLFTHNVEAEIFARHVQVAKDPLRRLVWQNQLRKMRHFEGETLRRFDAVIAVSDRDQTQFEKQYGVNAETIPTGVDLDFFGYEAPARDDANLNLVITASMDYYANIDGVRWFMEACWPHIAAAEPNARMTVVGRKPDPGLVRAAADRNLPWTFTGFVDDVRPYVHNSAGYVIPLRVGGGTRIKAYEAMALGCPVVSTSVGMEGLQASPERDYLLADDPAVFAAAAVRLLRDGELRARLAQNARRLVEAHFSAANVARVFEGICLRALQARVGRVGFPQACEVEVRSETNRRGALADRVR
jgi:glycosyltransferase involved in cell wall biosynthesis